MEYEFDEIKSAANKAKHGLDFSEAQKLWQDVDAVESRPNLMWSKEKC